MKLVEVSVERSEGLSKYGLSYGLESKKLRFYSKSKDYSKKARYFVRIQAEANGWDVVLNENGYIDYWMADITEEEFNMLAEALHNWYSAKVETYSK